MRPQASHARTRTPGSPIICVYPWRPARAAPSPSALVDPRSNRITIACQAPERRRPRRSSPTTRQVSRGQDIPVRLGWSPVPCHALLGVRRAADDGVERALDMLPGQPLGLLARQTAIVFVDRRTLREGVAEGCQRFRWLPKESRTSRPSDHRTAQRRRCQPTAGRCGRVPQVRRLQVGASSPPLARPPCRAPRRRDRRARPPFRQPARVERRERQGDTLAYRWAEACGQPLPSPATPPHGIAGLVPAPRASPHTACSIGFRRTSGTASMAGA